MEHAAVKIQTKYRQFKAKSRVSLMREERNAAVKIQAGFRGFKARQQVQLMRYSGSIVDLENMGSGAFYPTCSGGVKECCLSPTFYA